MKLVKRYPLAEFSCRHGDNGVEMYSGRGIERITE